MRYENENWRKKENGRILNFWYHPIVEENEYGT